MIYSGLSVEGANPTYAGMSGVTSAIHAAYISTGPCPPDFQTSMGFDSGVSAGTQSIEQSVKEVFDWEDPRTRRAFIRLEQRVLANRASQDERDRYLEMERSRNATVFADRQIRDYAEIQRLKILSRKLAEIQQFLKPIALP
jgi:hypothetical protein